MRILTALGRDVVTPQRSGDDYVGTEHEQERQTIHGDDDEHLICGLVGVRPRGFALRKEDHVGAEGVCVEDHQLGHHQ